MKTITLGCLVGLAISSTGCLSATIADAGRDLDRYDTRSEVYGALGPPISSGFDAANRYDDFRFRGKVRDQGSAQGAGTLGALTLGLSEAVFVPAMLVALPGQLFETHDVRYFYDEAGNVVNYEERSFDVADER